MASFVKHLHKGRGEIRLVIARGDAYIFRDATTERMVALIQATMFKIETDPVHQGAGESALLV